MGLEGHIWEQVSVERDTKGAGEALSESACMQHPASAHFRTVANMLVLGPYPTLEPVVPRTACPCGAENKGLTDVVVTFMHLLDSSRLTSLVRTVLLNRGYLVNFLPLTNIELCESR